MMQVCVSLLLLFPLGGESKRHPGGIVDAAGKPSKQVKTQNKKNKTQKTKNKKQKTKKQKNKKQKNSYPYWGSNSNIPHYKSIPFHYT